MRFFCLGVGAGGAGLGSAAGQLGEVIGRKQQRGAVYKSVLLGTFLSRLRSGKFIFSK